MPDTPGGMPANPQAQKDSVSRLAGGVAHDFNNLLTVMSGYANLLLEDSDVTPAVRRKLQEIVNAANRAKELTDKLITLSRTQAPEVMTFSIDPSPASEPAAPASARTAAAAAAAPFGARGDVRGGDERILVVEDEDAVRLLTRTILARLGYSVTEARTPAEAVQIMRDGLRVDLIVTDVVMPGMNGRRMVSEIEQIASGFEVLYVSGFAETTIGLSTDLEEDEARFLAKPFEPEMLARKVRQLLDSAMTSG